MLASCSPEAPPVRIDGSSAEAFQRTASAARDQLPVEQRLTFDTALRTVGGRRHSARDPESLARTTFDGMTAAEVVADMAARDGRGTVR